MPCPSPRRRRLAVAATVAQLAATSTASAQARKLIDCLIAAVAIRNEVPILHADTDFDAIARCTALEVDAP